MSGFCSAHKGYDKDCRICNVTKSKGDIEMTQREKQCKFWHMVALLILKADDLNTPFFIFEWLRSEEQQKINVARGASQTMNSKHLLGLAIDIVFLADVQDDGKVNFVADQFAELGEYWESIGGRWGGRFGDNPATTKIEGWDAGHFELNE